MELKKIVKRKGKEFVDEQKEKRAFLKAVAAEEKIARRETFKEESIIQAKLEGIRLAKERATPIKKKEAYSKASPSKKKAVYSFTPTEKWSVLNG